MISEVGADGNGTIEFPAFLTLMARRMKDTDSEQDILEAFKVFDKDSNGFVSAAELRHNMKLRRAGSRMLDTDSDDNPSACHAEDGTMSYEEFVKMLAGDRARGGGG